MASRAEIQGAVYVTMKGMAIDEKQDLVVNSCDNCGEKRLTARTRFGRDLCSECMRQVPMGFRPSVAKGLGYPQGTGDEEEANDRGKVDDLPPGRDHDSPTAKDVLRGVLSDHDGWLSTTELAERTEYHIAYVRERLRRDEETHSRNKGGPRPTEWAYPDQPDAGDLGEQLPEPNTEWDGDALIEARKDAELTQQALADLVGVSQAAISKWERRESKPDANTIKTLKDSLTNKS
jgi:DNA-binding transcriptional regulator YiaG